MKKVGALALFAFYVLALAGSAQAADISQDEPGHVEKCEVGRTDYSSDMAKVTRYPDGGSTYTFTYGDEGNTETIGQPPQGFDPLKASDEELARYSFPPRPGETDGKEVTQQSLSEWEDLVSGFKKAGPPITCEGPVDPGSTNSEPVENTVYSKSWAGHMVHSNEGERSVATFGHFYEPSGNEWASCKPTALVSNWLGLGGWNGSGKLLQSGTGTATNNQHTIWWQGYWEEGNGTRGHLQPQYFMEKVPFGAGSYMGFYTGYNLAEYKAYFYLSNESTGVTWPIATGLAPKYYDGSSAESMTERPGNGKPEGEGFGYYPMLNFHRETFWNIKWQNSYNEVRNIGEASFYTWHADMQMTDTGVSNGALIAAPNTLSLYQNYELYYYGRCQ